MIEMLLVQFENHCFEFESKPRQFGLFTVLNLSKFRFIHTELVAQHQSASLTIKYSISQFAFVGYYFLTQEALKFECFELGAGLVVQTCSF